MKLYLATTNPGKLRDFAQALTPGYALEPLPGLANMPVPEETADTFEGNARIKAEAYSLAAPGLLVLADDSGLEVDALGGAPGVRSARYADDLGFAVKTGETHDERNNSCLQAQMMEHPLERGARYRCTLALARDGRVLAVAHGTVEGEMLSQLRGTAGFGYDSLFLLPETGLSMAEVDPETRQRHSHRARALAALLSQIRGLQAEAAHARRTSILLAITPMVLATAAALGFLLVLALLLYWRRDGLQFRDVPVTQARVLASMAATLLLIAVCAWAAMHAFRSRVALTICGVTAAAFVIYGLASAVALLMSPAPFAAKILQVSFSPLPLLALGTFGLYGTNRALHSSVWLDIAQTER